MKWVEDLGEGEHTKRENSISNGPEVEWLVMLKWKAWLGCFALQEFLGS